MDGRTDIVPEAGQRQLGRARPPPIVAAASITSTDRPARARVTAAASPFGPAPMMTAS